MSTLGAEINGSLVPVGQEGSVPSGLSFPLVTSATPVAGKMQFITVDPGTGLANAADSALPYQIAGGFVYPDELITFDASNSGNAIVRTSWRYANHNTPSTIANDGFTAASVGTVWWHADTETPGALSHTGTVAGANLFDRSLGGLVLGLVRKGSPAIRFWVGPVAQAIARGVLLANAFPGGSWAKAVDASASTDLAEVVIDNQPKAHGPVIGVEFLVEGTTLAASGTSNYATLTLSRRDGAGGVAVVVATADSQTTAWTQWTAVTFALSAVAGAVNGLETDIFTIQRTHTGSGAALPAGRLRVIRKVI